MKVNRYGIILVMSLACLLCQACEKKDNPPINTGILQLIKVEIGDRLLTTEGIVEDIAVNESLVISFSSAVDSSDLKNELLIRNENQQNIDYNYSFSSDYREITINPSSDLEYFTNYTLILTDKITGRNGQSFPGLSYNFKTRSRVMVISSISINGEDFSENIPVLNIDRERISIDIQFSDTLNESDYKSYFILSGNIPLEFDLTENNTRLLITNSIELTGYTKYFFTVSSNLTSVEGSDFEGFSNSFHTTLDSTLKYPEISDDELLTKIQEYTFRYFYDFAHPQSGMARERNTSGNTVTTGGSGMGIMALIVGVERSFISRTEAMERMDLILTYLETGDSFHGVFPHWMNGLTGKVQPFSTYDNGADLVETSFLFQGLLTFRQYLNVDDPLENELHTRIDSLWQAVEWDWHTQGGQNVLYWHWSPNYAWQMNHQIRGHNETLITYLLAVASPTHDVDVAVYHQGYMRSGAVLNGKSFYGIKLPMGQDLGGPLFFTHYSFLGLDPRNLVDSYVNYMEQNIAHSRINQAYSADNPRNYVGYSESGWGLTASDGYQGYSAHSPTNDKGIITPTAAISSIPYVPELSLDAIHHFYYLLGDKLWGEYGFYDAFGPTYGWWADSYLAIDQGPIIIMIENYRTALLWELFMSAPEITTALDKMGFTY